MDITIHGNMEHTKTSLFTRRTKIKAKTTTASSSKTSTQATTTSRSYLKCKHGTNNNRRAKCGRSQKAGLRRFLGLGIMIVMMTSMLKHEVTATAVNKIMHNHTGQQMAPPLIHIATDQRTTKTAAKLIPSLEASTSLEISGVAANPEAEAAAAFVNNNIIDDDFHPIIPKDIPMESISANVFTKSGQYRVFQPDESDLRAAAARTNRVRWRWQLHGNNQQGETQKQGQENKQQQHPEAVINNCSESSEEKSAGRMQAPTEEWIVFAKANSKQRQATTPETTTTTAPPSSTGSHHETLSMDSKRLEDLLLEYVEKFFIKGEYEPLPELLAELQKNRSTNTQRETDGSHDNDNAETDGPADGNIRDTREIGTVTTNSSNFNFALPPSFPATLFSLLSTLQKEEGYGKDIPRDLQSGRLIFVTGLKKMLWPIMVGLQILKSLLFAMFLPTLIGSFGKIVSKGISAASIRPLEAPQDLDFHDNSFNFDEENNKFIINDDGGGGKDEATYQQQAAEATQPHYTTFNAGNLNYQPLSRFGGPNEKQLHRMPDSYMNALQSIGAASFKNSGSLSSSSSQAFAPPSMYRKPMPAANTNNFQTFQNVPATSLLLSNYDPFYSPLLSRLDSVFAQLKLNSENEVCREKLICLMYANPAKYAPYSNLVSAQLSRELNELRKPTSDNPDILRFFKYMRAAKDGQDGVDCEKTFDGCKEFKDYENPAMLSTYHDINKLVQARKLI